MVVSAESQKIKRKHYSVNKKSQRKVLSVSGRAMPLYLIPFTTALLIFSISINFIDFLWEAEEPKFRIEHITLPDENSSRNPGKQILKAEAPVLFPSFENEYERTDANKHRISVSEYRVREGDRFSTIANKFDITIDTLISANGLSSVSEAEEGDVLKIPRYSGIYYSVDKGENLSSISRRFDTTVEVLIEANDLVSTVLHPGERLFIPNAGLGEDVLDKIIGNRFVIPAVGTVKNNHGSYVDPVTGLKNYNYGIDILNKKGTAVYAAKSGVIGNTSYNAYYGRVVQVNHSGAMQSMYSCLDSIDLKQGYAVERGDLLGYMGNSGFRAGEHLQFSIFKNKEDVDTLEFIF